MQKIVISTIAIAFAQTKGNGYISFDPLVSKPAPEWLPRESNFKEAQDKGFVRLSQDVEISKVTGLDAELVKVANDLNLTFNADINQGLLEDMVKEAQDKLESEKDKVPETPAVVNTPVVEQDGSQAVVEKAETKADVPQGAEEDIEAKRDIIVELQGLGFNGAKVKWKLETLQNKLEEIKGK